MMAFIQQGIQYEKIEHAVSYQKLQGGCCFYDDGIEKKSVNPKFAPERPETGFPPHVIIYLKVITLK